MSAATASANAAAPARDSTLDLLRAGAILYIVGYYHIQEVWIVHLPGGLSGWLARIALALFCFISGHLLARAPALDSLRDVGRFLRRRFLRIYPLYLAALLGFVSLGLCPKALLLTSAFLINSLLNWNLLTLWFVSMIFLFYLVAPFFFHRPHPRKTIFLTLGIFLLLLFLKSEFRLIDPRIFPNFLAFTCGIFLQQLPDWGRSVLLPNRKTQTGCLFAVGILTYFTAEKLPDDAAPLHSALILIWFFASLPLLFASARTLSRHLPAATIQAAASASFVLYLSHRLIYFAGNLIGPSNGIVRQLYFLCFLLPLALLFSWFIQKNYDRLLR